MTLDKICSMSRKRSLLTLMVALITLALSVGCHGDKAALVGLERARQVAADLRVQFNKAADASDRAVMADTDEASIAAAREAAQTSRIVEADIAQLGPLLQSLHYQDELGLLGAFKNHFVEYLNLDRSILELAVENTNLKAQRLSFGPLRESADKFRDSVESIAGALARPDRCRVDRLVASAILAVREIQVLHAPHIAESDTATMTRIERELDNLQATASNAVTELSVLADAKAPALVASAQKELLRFKEISGQIVALSRRNSNVRSLDLALRMRPPLTMVCDGNLRAIQEALTQEGSKATR
jgi:hypothetical protein